MSWGIPYRNGWSSDMWMNISACMNASAEKQKLDNWVFRIKLTQMQGFAINLYVIWWWKVQ